MHHQPKHDDRARLSRRNTKGILTLVGLVMCAVPIAMAWADQPPPRITLDRALHVIGIDGQDLVVGPGGYRVEAHEAHLRLTPADGQESLLVQASPTVHEETVSAPVAMVVTEEGNDDQVHIVLLLPEAKGVEAVGSLSGITSRATSFSRLSRTQMQQAYAQQRQSVETPNRLPPIKVAPITLMKPVGPTPGARASGPGRWVTWNYLAMHHPQVVAQALAEVQAGVLPITAVGGLASAVELKEILKTDWKIEVAQMKALRSSALAPQRVTPRAIDQTGKTAAGILSRPAPLKAAANSLIPVSFPLPLEPKDLGEVYSGQPASGSVTLTAPEDGVILAFLGPDAIKKRFRVHRVRTFTGEFAQGRPVIEKEYQGVEMSVKRGQLVEIEVVFEPDPGAGPPVGNYEVLLEIDGVGQTGKKWKRTSAIRARCMGIDFGLLALAEVGHVTTLTDQMVEMPLILTNPGPQQYQGQITATQLPPGVTMEPVNFSHFVGQQRFPLRFRVSKTAREGFSQAIVVQVAGIGRVPFARRVDLSMTIFHPTVFWCFGRGGWCPTKDIPGIDNATNNVNDQRLWETNVWIRDDGNWGWDATVGNLNIIDIAGTEMSVEIYFDGPVMDQVRGNVGPGSETFTRVRGHTWIRENYLLAAERGVSFSFCCFDK